MIPTKFYSVIEEKQEQIKGYIIAEDENGYRKRFLLKMPATAFRSEVEDEAAFYVEFSNDMAKRGQAHFFNIGDSPRWENYHPTPGSFAYIEEMESNRRRYDHFPG